MAGLRSAFGIAPTDVDQEQALKELFPTANAPAVTNDVVDRQTAGEFQRGLRSGYFGALQAAPRALVGAAQDALGYRDAAQRSYDNVNALLRRAGDSAPTTKWDEVDGPGSLGRYAAGAVGNALATTLPGVAVGLATRSPRLGLATMFPMEAGETAAEVAQMPAAQRPDPAATLRTSLGKGMVNTAIEAAPFMHMFGQGPLRAVTSGITNPVARFGGRALTQMTAEGGTEYLQQATGQYAQSQLQPGRDTSGDAADRAEAFRQGFFGAAPFGGMAGISGAVQDTKDFARSGVDKAADFLEKSKGKAAADILADLQGKDREKRYSMFINGNPTAEEDVVKHGPKSLLMQQLKDKTIDPRRLGTEIDAFMRGEKGYDDTKKAAEFMNFLDNAFGGRQYVEPILDKYEKGIDDTGTLVTRPEEVRAEMNKPPSWLDSDGVTSFSEADLELSGDDFKQYVAEEHGLQSMFEGDSNYIYDGALTSRRPFSNKAAGRAAVERAKRMNPHVTNAEYIPVLQAVYESGLSPEDTRRELMKATRESLQNDINEGNKLQDKGDKAGVERIQKRIRDGNDILKKLGNEVADPETGEIKFDKSIVEALSDVYVVRTNGSGDDQKFSPKDVKEMKPGSDDVPSTLQFATDGGRPVNINVREMMRKHMKRADKLDDNGSLVPPRVWMYRALMSGLAGLQNSGLQLKGELNDDLLIYADRKGENRITLGDLKKADQAMATRDRRVTNEGIESPEEQAAREYRSDAARNAYSDTTGFTATGEGPEGAAGESFDPTANTLREQQPGGPPRYTDKGEEIWGQEQEANIRRFEEGLVGDPTKVGAQWGNHLNPAPDQVTAAPGKLINESMEPRGFNTPAGADQPTALPAQKPTKLTPEDVKPENERVTTYSVKDIDAQIDEVMRAIMANGNKAEPDPNVDQQLFASLQALRAQRVAAVREERAAVAESKKGGGGVKLAEQPQQKVTDPFAYPEGPNRPWQAGISEAEAPKVERTEPDVPPLAGGPPAADISVPVEQRQHEARMKDEGKKPLSTKRKDTMARAKRAADRAAKERPDLAAEKAVTESKRAMRASQPSELMDDAPPATEVPEGYGEMPEPPPVEEAAAPEVKKVTGDIWEMPGMKVVTTNLGGVHGRGLAKQASQKRLISGMNNDFDSSPFDKGVITLAVKGAAPETAKIPGKAFSEATTGKNVKLLESEVNKLIAWARKHQDTRINLPYAGLGFGEGNPEEIMPILERAATEPNIYLVSRSAEATEKYADTLRPGVRGDKTKAEAPKAEPTLLSRIQDSSKLDSAAFKALVEETRGVLKEGKLPLEERKALAKALGEAGTARTRAVGLEQVSEDELEGRKILNARRAAMFDEALKSTPEEMERKVRATIREVVSVGLRKGKVAASENSLSAMFNPTQTRLIAQLLDDLGRFAEIAKNPDAEKWVRNNLDASTDAITAIDMLLPLVDDQFTKSVLTAVRLTIPQGTKVEKADLTANNQLGSYAPGEGVIRLEKTKPMLKTLIHELVHAATLNAVAKNPAAFDALHTLFEHVRSTNKFFDETYGATNVYEFLAEGLSNANLRQLLRNTPANAEVKSLLGKVKNLWEGFVRVIRQSLGMKQEDENALGQFLDVAGALMKQTREQDLQGDSQWAKKGMMLTSPVIRKSFAEKLGKLPEHLRKGVEMVLDDRAPAQIDLLALQTFTSSGARDVGEAASAFEAERHIIAQGIRPTDLPDSEVSLSRSVETTDTDLTAEEQEKIKDLIKKQRGPDVAISFMKALQVGPEEYNEFGQPEHRIKAAGRFFKEYDSGKRIIDLAVDVSFATAESAAYHESMHDFLASLRGKGSTPEMRAAAATIENMHKNVEVMMQLKELLKDHPDAWKAAQDDPNEAAAYIYQFWVKGHITVGPAPRNLFEKLVKFFRDALNIVGADDKARMLMDALAKGNFSKPSVAADVLNSLKVETFRDKTMRIAGPLMKVTSVVASSTTDRLREMDIPAFTEIADLFHKEADQERGRLGYLQKNGQMGAQWRARLNKVLSGHSKDDLKKALEIMQGRQDSDMPLVKEIRSLLDDMYDYMSKAGVKEAERKLERVWDENQKQEVEKEVTHWVPIKKVAYNYFPRFWDQAAIQRDQAKFVNLLMKHGGISEAEAVGIVRAITSSPQDEIVDETTYTPYMMSANNRRLHFINKANSGEFAEFQKQDLVEIMTNYVSHTVRRAESTRAFGHAYERVDSLIEQARFEGATEEDVKVAQRAVAAMTGSLRHNMDRGIRQFMTNMIAYENVVLLPFALLNNLTDVVHVALRSGDLSEGWRAFGTGIAEMKNAIMRQPPSEQKRFAEALGTIDETVALGAYGEAYEGMYMTGFARKLNDAFFKYNGMQTWNHAMRTAATQAAVRFVLRHATGEKTEHSDRYLYELGLDREFVSKLIDKDGNLAVFREDVAKALGVDRNSGEAAVAETKIQEALYRFADDAALRPNAAHRPIWGSDPYYMLLFHLKQFTYTFQAVTAKFMNKELAYGSAMPVAVLMAYAPFALAIQTVRSLMLGRQIDTSFGGVMMSLAKSGTMLGTGTFGLDALKDTAMGRVPGISLIGPAPAHGLAALQTLLGADGTSLAKLAERSVPLSPLVKAIS